MENKYDSLADSLKHIKRVNFLVNKAAINLIERAITHDDSKLVEPEKSYFDQLTPEFRLKKYGSAEYLQAIEKVQPGLDMHHANNSHHPQHYPNGINGMDLFDLIEMLCDWKAATEHNPNGDFVANFNYNCDLFEIDKQTERLLWNTALKMNFIK